MSIIPLSYQKQNIEIIKYNNEDSLVLGKSIGLI